MCPRQSACHWYLYFLLMVWQEGMVREFDGILPEGFGNKRFDAPHFL